MKYYFTTRLGPNRYEMGDGSLLCKDVPIARTGTQSYRASDLPEITPDADGEIIVTRTPQQVFCPETLASFEGMTVVILHPEDERGNITFVDPENWRQLAIGHVTNVRQGQGEQEDLMLADLVIKDQSGIQAIFNGLTQVSCGYDAEYDVTAPGKANQYHIRGNHAALVPHGRAGIRCSIGDSNSMTSKAKQWLSNLKRAVKTKDAEATETLLDNAPDNLVGDEDDVAATIVVKVEGPDAVTAPAVDPTNPTSDDESDINARVAALEAAVKTLIEQLTPPTGDAETEEDAEQEKTKTGDAGYQQEALSRAELILPGFSLPGAKTGTIKRDVLSAAFRTADGRKLIEPLAGSNPDFGTMQMATVDSIFNGAAELAKNRNNSAQSLAVFSVQTQSTDVAALNASNKEFWNNKGAK